MLDISQNNYLTKQRPKNLPNKKSPQVLRLKSFSREAGDGIRTHDINLGKVALYH
jgi:hypothetical protein